MCILVKGLCESEGFSYWREQMKCKNFSFMKTTLVKISSCYKFVCTFWHYHLQSPKQLCSVIFSTEKYGALFCVFGVSVVGVSILPLFPMVGCVIQDCILLQKLVSGGVCCYFEENFENKNFWRNFSVCQHESHASRILQIIATIVFQKLGHCSSISALFIHFI